MTTPVVTDHGPSISIIVASFNASRTIERCLRSVIAQTHPETELIVIDGGSSDGTLDILRKLDTSISHWVSEPDSGIYDAWNKGLAHATGEWIGFLGADDYFWTSGALEALAAVCRTAYPTSRIVYGRVAVVDEDGTVLFTVGKDWSKASKRFHDVMSIPHTGLLHHRSVFSEHGFFDESYRIAGDYELLLRELRHRPASFADAAGISVGMGAGGISNQADRTLLLLREARRAQRANGFSRPGIGWIARMGLRRVLGQGMSRRVRGLARWVRGRWVYRTRN